MLYPTPPARIREFRHVFAGPRRITASIRIDLASVCLQPHIMACIHCEWDGSKVRQPRAELYPEFKSWMDYVVSAVVAITGTPLLYLFEVPESVKQIELWLYRDKRQPRLLKTLPNPCPKPLSEVLANLPPANWEEAE